MKLASKAKLADNVSYSTIQKLWEGLGVFELFFCLKELHRSFHFKL